jgi:predicted hydrocarbon binding protein
MITHTENSVTNISIRAAYDSIADILGERARNLIFRSAGLDTIIQFPPDYTWDKNFTNDQQLSIYAQTVGLVGVVGAQGILRQIGYKNAETTVLKFKILDHISNLPDEEKIIKCFEFFRIVVNKGRIVSEKGGLPKFDVFDCLTCDGIRSKKPFCSQYAGALSFMTDWVYGKGVYIVREMQCKATGDDTCLFEIIPRH